MSQTKPASYHCEAQQRVLKTLFCLFGHEIDGLAPSQVAKRVGASPGNTTRDLWNLEDLGLIERLPVSDRVRISPLLGRKALAVLHTFDRAQRQLTDLSSRFTTPD